MSNEVVKKEESRPRYRPATDILEREDGFHIFMDMPGVGKEDLTIDLQEGELVVSGRTSYENGGKESYAEMQFGNCEYRTSIAISDIVDRERITANLDRGVLALFLPRMVKEQPRKIRITAE